mmetsp:Transcript_25840/g.53956  ORF Transcript_25840/g.53956 Transcript_25840/m.53956 type:complete len:81 (+) Transcript_25840:251-493(+)
MKQQQGQGQHYYGDQKRNISETKGGNILATRNKIAARPTPHHFIGQGQHYFGNRKQDCSEVRRGGKMINFIPYFSVASNC